MIHALMHGKVVAIDNNAGISRGQLDYEADVAKRPLYHDRTPRKAWHQLCAIAKWSWERRPTK